MDCLFCKITSKQLNSTLLLETDELVAFKDIHPQAPVHVLIVPKKHISTLNEASGTDFTLIGNMLKAAQELARQLGVAEAGYRTVFNCNKEGGQTVFHLHLHLLAGKQLGGGMTGIL